MDYLFQLSDTVVNSVNTTFRRYLLTRIPLPQRLVIIRGARGTGKTTLLIQLLKSTAAERHEKLYLSLDNIYFLGNRLFDIADKFRKHGGRYLFLDEIHRYPGWALEIKNIYDHFHDLSVIATGSSAVNIHMGEADLSRRALIYRLNELSVREFLEMSENVKEGPFSLTEILEHHHDIAAGISGRIHPLKIFNDYRHHGAYPFFLEGKDHYHERLRSGINAILDSDIPSLENISFHSVVQLKKLLFILSGSVPFTPNISELSRKTGIARDVLLRFLFLLEQGELLHLLRRESKGISYLSKPEKIFLHNPNISWALSSQTPDPGNLRETFLYNQMAVDHDVTYNGRGDFFVNMRYTIEVGGRKKGSYQIDGIADSYIAADDIETGLGHKIPLWLFGFLY